MATLFNSPATTIIDLATEFSIDSRATVGRTVSVDGTIKVAVTPTKLPYSFRATIRETLSSVKDRQLIATIANRDLFTPDYFVPSESRWGQEFQYSNKNAYSENDIVNGLGVVASASGGNRITFQVTSATITKNFPIIQIGEYIQIGNYVYRAVDQAYPPAQFGTFTITLNRNIIGPFPSAFSIIIGDYGNNTYAGTPTKGIVFNIIPITIPVAYRVPFAPNYVKYDDEFVWREYL